VKVLVTGTGGFVGSALSRYLSLSEPYLEARAAHPWTLTG